MKVPDSMTRPRASTRFGIASSAPAATVASASRSTMRSPAIAARASGVATASIPTAAQCRSTRSPQLSPRCSTRDRWQAAARRAAARFTHGECRDLGIDDPPLQPNHGCRCRFADQCRKHGVPRDVRFAVDGHALNDQGDHYGEGWIGTQPGLALHAHFIKNLQIENDHAFIKRPEHLMQFDSSRRRLPFKNFSLQLRTELGNPLFLFFFHRRAKPFHTFPARHCVSVRIELKYHSIEPFSVKQACYST
jgi:hypothetical protein